MDTDPRHPNLRTAADATLLEQFAARGDGLAFAVLVERHGGMVLGLCRRLLRHEQDAEDAFQATFLVLARKAGSIRKSESIGSWLYGVASRVARRARAAPVHHDSPEGGLQNLPAPDEREGIGQDIAPLLDEALNELPPAFRGPVVLCYIQGRSTEDAARSLGCPRGTVLSRLARARERLRIRLTRRGVTLTAAAIATVLARNVAAAEVPLPLAYSTIQAAAPSAAGTAAAAGAVSARAVVLAKGVLKAMWVTKLTQVAAVALVLAVGAAGVFGARAWADRAGGDKDGKPAASKPATLEGSWVATEIVKNGSAAPKEVVDRIKIVIKDDEFTLHDGDQVIKGKATRDTTAKPATIDVVLTDGETSAGIYELNGDTLKICTGHQDVPRPTAFESKEGSGHALIILKRAKS
jgi:RNA polymerase sigma factor (sigma-70 family)